MNKSLSFAMASTLIVVVGIIGMNAVYSFKKDNIPLIKIQDLNADPGAYTGIVSIRGVVIYADEQQYIFRMISEEEYLTCGLQASCNPLGTIAIYTPGEIKHFGNTPSDFTYNVKMPSVTDLVTVYGEIKKNGDQYAFEVEKVTKGSVDLITRI